MQAAELRGRQYESCVGAPMILRVKSGVQQAPEFFLQRFELTPHKIILEKSLHGEHVAKIIENREFFGMKYL